MNAPTPRGSWLYDTFVNLLTNLGVAGKDRSVSMDYSMNQLGPQQLQMAYRGDWIARKVIDVPAQDATRAWRSWEMDKVDIGKIEDAEKALSLPLKLQNAIKKARLFGGAVMILGVDKGKPEEELEYDGLGKDCLKFIHVASRYEVTPGPRVGDIMSPWYGQPEYYERNTIASGNVKEASQVFGVRIHPSRVIQLLGNEYPDMQSAPDIWSDSSLQVVDDAIRGVGTVAGSLAQLITDAKVDIIKIPNLTQIASTTDGEAKLTRRFAFANASKGIINALLMDKDEEWERKTCTFTGMPEVLQMYLLIASGAADIPVTRLLGQSPAGMNATGESDIRNYYDRLNSDQNMRMTPILTPLDQVLVRHALGTFKPEWFYTWNSLWQLDDIQKAALAKSKADTFKIDNDAAVIPVDILREARENQLIEDGSYPGLEETIKDWEAENGDQNEAPDQLVPPPLDPNDPEGLNAPPVPGQTTPPKGKPKAVAPKKKITTDARPRGLFVYRKVLNTKDLVEWAREVGFKSMLKADELHVTICYSREPLDWTKVYQNSWGQDEQGRMHIPPGGMRLVDRLGDQGAIVLFFASSDLCWRHSDIERAGAKYDYPDYQPHITITYDPEVNLRDVVDAYQGPIILGPEVFEEIQPQGNYTPDPSEEVVL